MVNFNKNNFFLKVISQACFIIFLFQLQTFGQTSDTNNSPVILDRNPIYLHQGKVSTVTIRGNNLGLRNAIGVDGDNVIAFIVKEESDGSSITVTFDVDIIASLGERELFIISSVDNSTKDSIPVIVESPLKPSIERITTNKIPTQDSEAILRITGTELTNVTKISSNSDDLIINSYEDSQDGKLLTVSTTFTQSFNPDFTYKLEVANIGGATTVDFISKDIDLSNVDPLASRIYSLESNPTNKKQIILKGSMFDPDPSKNKVTILENDDGTVIARQVEIISSDKNEIIVNLPDNFDLSNSGLISFAVSNFDGKSSNIKTIDLDLLYNDIKEHTITGIDLNTVAANITASTISSIVTEGNQASQHMTESISITANPQKNPTLQNTELTEDKNIIQNVTNINQYLFSNSTIETPVVTLDENPVKLISTIEENKQIKNQVDLIMIALDDAKSSQEFSETIKKAESLRAKVDELEKMLSIEKQKNKPDLRKLAKYEGLLANANAESRSQTFTLLNNLLQYKPQLKNLLTQKPFDLATVQPNIPSNSVILQYVPTEEGLIIFVVDNNNLKTRINKNISKDILNREVQAYRQLLEQEIEKIKLTGRTTPIISWKNDKSNIYKNDIRPLKEKTVFLYNALVEPIEKDIINKKVVAIIANGWLRYLPFQSLASLKSNGDLNFLISNKSIVYLDSVIALNNDHISKLSNMAAITVFANPDGTLSGANKEAEIITKLFNKSTTTLVQKPFNVSLVNQLAKKADILHLATHGYLDSSDISSSYLVSGKKPSGKQMLQEKLYLKDIYDLNLNNSKLVVLSGCDTGKLGSLSNEPDDVVGSLATAFRVAGANTILASLWKAHDEATKIIMQNFYENIRAGLDKAESLRRAELKVKENPKYSHPLFWGLFNLIGDWR